MVLSHTLFLQDHDEKLAEVQRAQRMCQVPGNQGVSLPPWKVDQYQQSLQQIRERCLLTYNSRETNQIPVNSRYQEERIPGID